MKALQDDSGNLIVTNVETFVRALLGAFGVWIVAVWVAPIPTRQSLGWSAVCVAFVVALLAANERSTFLFDRRAGILRWSQGTLFRHQTGEMPFTAITALSVERDFRFRGATPSQGRGGARRLVLVTTSGVIPFTSAYTGIGSDAEDVGATVQRYLADVAPGREVPLRTP